MPQSGTAGATKRMCRTLFGGTDTVASIPGVNAVADVLRQQTRLRLYPVERQLEHLARTPSGRLPVGCEWVTGRPRSGVRPLPFDTRRQSLGEVPEKSLTTHHLTAAGDNTDA
jgi:hypothetical protein